MSGAFRLIGEEEEPRPAPTVTPMENATGMLMLALRSLSKRFVSALLNLFGLFTLASVWWLWMSTPNPDANQLISLGMYATFVVVMNFLTRRFP